MSLFRRKNSPHWWYQITDATGKRIQKSTGTSDEVKAQELHDRLKVSVWDQKRLGIKQRRTWEEAVLRWLEDKAKKSSLTADKSHLRFLDRFLREKFLDEIDADLIRDITQARRQAYELPRKKGPARQIEPKATTVNRTLEVLRGVLIRAHVVWQWLDRIPPVPMDEVPPPPTRWIKRDKAEELLEALPHHQQAMVRFALDTGLRRSNITHLQWSDVDLDRRQAWVHADQAKAGKPIGIPLSAEGLAVLQGQKGKDQRWVFPYRGKPVTQVATKAWRTAVKKVGIARGFRWHDLRHTWASWHAQDRTPLDVLQILGGWGSIEMVQRYAHLDDDHLHQWVDRRVSLKSQATQDADELTTQKKKATEEVA
ncbi:MAG: tyrosine-type recombinase/integrase [Planctomycetota bacterium]|nr:tyrosine-type recombinase/integrase [Planctomycetota bacterium]